jgi:hypothetical protein
LFRSQLYEFCFDPSYDGDGNVTCLPEKACKIDGQYSEEAFGVMRENGWHLNCADYKYKKESKM